MDMNSKICIAGSEGLLGHAIVKQLENAGYTKIIHCDLPQINLCNQLETERFFNANRPDYVFFLAAIAGGIQFKKDHPADMLLKNLQMITNVFDASQRYGCKKMINVCSALLYPVEAIIPIEEKDATYVNLGLIDTPYSLAKATGMQLARNYNQQYGTHFLTVVPCNFFGEYAPFVGDKAGVVSALIARIYNAKIKGIDMVEVWGSGNVCREFLNSQDVASACIFLMESETKFDLINIGRGYEFTIKEVAEMIKKVVGYDGKLFFDASKPEGRSHMQLNTDRLFDMGWRPSMDLEKSIRNAFEWYVSSINNSRN